MMLDGLKKYIYQVIFGLIVLGAGWVAVINTRTFDSAKQKVNIVDAVEAMPSEAEIAVERAVRMSNDSHAIVIRQLRYDKTVRDDSIKKEYDRKKDSTFFDKIDRQTVQIEQMKEKIDNN